MPRLETGQTAPAFTLSDHAGRSVSLSDFVGRNLIIFFYPAAMTPGCTKEACDFRDSLARLQNAGYDVVGISPDKRDKLARFVEKESLTYPLLSDTDSAVMDAYGAYGEKMLYGKKVTGRDPFDHRRRTGRQRHPAEVQRQGHRSRRLPVQGPRARLTGIQTLACCGETTESGPRKANFGGFAATRRKVGWRADPMMAVERP